MPETIVYSGSEGEREPNYTRLIATDINGPHRGDLFLIFDYSVTDDDGLFAFPVFRSSDLGRTWHLVSHIRDVAFKVGNRFQPMLLELPEPVGAWPAGTLLAAGNAIPDDLSETHLVLYASQDGGATWTYLSEIDSGGPAEYDPSPGSATTAVWEPELRVVAGTLVCFYSDERYKHRNMLQTLVHKTSSDLKTWSGQVLDVGVGDRRTRPGMLVSTPLLPSGHALGVFEVVGGPDVPVHIIRSSDGLDWGDPAELGRRILSLRGTSLSGTPNMTCHYSGERFCLLVTGRTAVDVDGEAVNRALVCFDEDGLEWFDIDLPVAAKPSLAHDMAGYSQTLLLAHDGQTLVQATSRRNAAGNLDIVVGTTPFTDPRTS